MGIREFFEQHPPGEDLNIHDIVIKDEKREILAFDPEIEISDSDWQEMKDVLEVGRARGYKKGAWLPFFRFASAMKIIFPERAKELKLDASIRQAVVDVWNSPEDRVMMDKFEHAKEIKILFPDFDLRALYSPKLIKEMQSRVKEEFAGSERFAAKASDMKIGFPEIIREIGLDEKTWLSQKRILKHDRQKNDWSEFAQQAAGLKILFPEKARELGLDEEAWYSMKDTLRKWRHRTGRFDFTKMAANMKILAAHEVKITGRGIEFVMRPPEDFREQKKPRPERRQF